MNSSTAPLQPVVFVSHGSPVTALDQGSYAAALTAFGRSVAPKAIVIISAHWQERGVCVTSAPNPALVYDFGGFPRALYEMKYDAPGSPEIAAQLASELRRAGFESTLDPERGWDHGVWVPLRLMFPEANIPVVAVSLPTRPPEQLYKLGQAIASLRSKGVLILGSGGIVHNLRLMNWQDKDAAADGWARGFQQWVKEHVANHNLAVLFDYEKQAPYADRAVPTPEHFAPLFPVLGAAGPEAKLSAIFEGIEHGNMSMFSFQLVG